MTRRNRVEHAARAVVRPIVDDDDLAIERQIDRQETFDDRPDRSAFVIDGDNDGKKAGQAGGRMIQEFVRSVRFQPDPHETAPRRLMTTAFPNFATMSAPFLISLGTTRRSAIAYANPPGVSQRTNAGVSS